MVYSKTFWLNIGLVILSQVFWLAFLELAMRAFEVE